MSTDFKLGFCPTMANIAIDLKSKNDLIELYPFGSAAEALFYLKQNAMDGIVIGRFAKQAEISPQIDKQCLQKEGYTLISGQKGFIEFEYIGRLQVHTYLPETLVKEKFPELKNIQFHPDKNTALQNVNRTEVALIDWHDYEDRFELMIPVDEGGKIKKYRLPILYYQKAKAGLANKIAK